MKFWRVRRERYPEIEDHLTRAVSSMASPMDVACVWTGDAKAANPGQKSDPPSRAHVKMITSYKRTFPSAERRPWTPRHPVWGAAPQ